ncbi:hypothetical protein GNI_115270 [Gregarina niphandrodes]|uniref:Uncharacterized protein n=1 Tax=Gregarina niphandrodes TaxID=110365 RepID=A0A023B353_GRENI|nr:hypothetical protein GNI_115270 [Gregarina niphandrodes]EZG55298.1 hypothetical protein GNI_115270 [Gregarina niphandrodes]|eukprot:XP_011131677.1 hypothetical protein GNI_115270 [Gregarina niphandrodes]
MFNCGGCGGGNPLSLLFGSPSAPAEEEVSMSSIESVMAENSALVAEQWFPLVHPRVYEKWGEAARPQIRSVLTEIARNSRGDPVGTEEACVEWKPARLEVHMFDGRSVKLTDVRRALAFLFVDDDSYLALMNLARDENEPLETLCNNPRCANIRHVVIPD